MNLIELNTLTIERGNDIDAAMLMGSFTRYLYRDLDAVVVPFRPSFYDSVETSFDRLHGGGLFLSFAALAGLEELVDWDQWGEDGGGVFAYEHLEASDDKPYTEGTDLAAFLLREIPAAAWYEIAENWRVPAGEELEILLTRWCRQVGLPLLGDEANEAPVGFIRPDLLMPYDPEDFGLDAAELQAKYATEQEHPEYTNQLWGREAPTTPYWGWVVSKLAQGNDAD